VYPKSIHTKPVQVLYVDDNILTKYYFPWAYMEKRKRSETGFIALISSCTLLFGEEQTRVSGNSCK
jgi:hypothetical protein